MLFNEVSFDICFEREWQRGIADSYWQRVPDHGSFILIAERSQDLSATETISEVFNQRHYSV